MTDGHTEDEAREQIAAAEEAEARDRATGAASLFDLRLVIGGLLGLYGVVLTVMGLFASADAKAKAAGININLWAGLCILAAAAFFLAWRMLRPLRAEDLQAEDADSERPKVE
jgi:membrane-bound ClpP family serine protease